MLTRVSHITDEINQIVQLDDPSVDRTRNAVVQEVLVQVTATGGRGEDIKIENMRIRCGVDESFEGDEILKDTTVVVGRFGSDDLVLVHPGLGYVGL